MKLWIAALAAGGMMASAAATAGEAPKPDEFEKQHGSSFRLSEEEASNLTEPVEQSLQQARLPELIFNEAPMSEVMMRLQRATTDTVSTGTNKRGIDFVFNARSLGKHKPPVITFAAKNVSVLEVIRFVCASAGLEYKIAGGALILQKAKKEEKKDDRKEVADPKSKDTKTGTAVPPKK